jgi:anti-sigma B factor antagonist
MQEPTDAPPQIRSTCGLLTCRQYPHNGCTVVAAVGEIDLATAPTFRKALVDAVTAESPQLVIDLTAVTFMDSTGLAALVSARRRADERGGSVQLVGAANGVRRILDLTGLDRLFVIHDSVDAACA